MWLCLITDHIRGETNENIQRNAPRLVEYSVHFSRRVARIKAPRVDLRDSLKLYFQWRIVDREIYAEEIYRVSGSDRHMRLKYRLLLPDAVHNEHVIL